MSQLSQVCRIVLCRKRQSCRLVTSAGNLFKIIFRASAKRVQALLCRYISAIYRGCLPVKNSFINISEVNRQCLHSLGTRSEANFEKVSSTSMIHCEVMDGSHSRSVTKKSHGLLVEENLFLAWRPENWDAQLSNDVYHLGGFVWWKWVKIAIF